MLNLQKRYLWAAGFLLLILIFGAGMKYSDFKNANNQPAIELENNDTLSDEAEETREASLIQVYVTGAVAVPGVYKLPIDARVIEAVEMAQALPEANLKGINLAQKMDDGMAIIVPREGEDNLVTVKNSLISGATLTGGQPGKVNINSASVQELDERLPGIGPAIAQRIVDYRNLHGPFAKTEDLNAVSGIGDKKYAELKDLITVR